MTLELLALAWLAAPAAPTEGAPDRGIEQHRTAFDALTERAIGRTSRRVRFDWRRGGLQVAALGGLPAELNNYDSLRTGALLRVPTDAGLVEFGLSYVFVSGSESTERLALTPLRQAGRPDRFELDFGFAYPLAEGVSTAFMGFIPATELVLNAYGNLRYLLYPSGFTDLSFEEVAAALFAGTLSDKELANLEDERLPGMELDKARYGSLFGLGLDLYFQSGIFFSQKALIALPVLRFLTDTQLGYGYEFDISLGFAF